VLRDQPLASSRDLGARSANDSAISRIRQRMRKLRAGPRQEKFHKSGVAETRRRDAAATVMTLPARWSREQFLFRAACCRVVALYIYPPFSALLYLRFLFSRLPAPGFSPPLPPTLPLSLSLSLSLSPSLLFSFFSRFREDRFSDHSRRIKPKACCMHTRASETGWPRFAGPF